MTFRVLDVVPVFARRRPLLDLQKDSRRIVFVFVDDERDDDDDEEHEKEEDEESISREVRISFDDFCQQKRDDEMHFAAQKEASTGVVQSSSSLLRG